MKLNKSKKYIIKVDPIYELRESHFGWDMYIHKWSLKYTTTLLGELIAFFFCLWPTQFLSWRYEIDGDVFLCEKKCLENFADQELKNIYEEKMKKIEAENLERQNIKNKQKDIIENLNSVFTKNYN